MKIIVAALAIFGALGWGIFQDSIQLVTGCGPVPCTAGTWQALKNGAGLQVTRVNIECDQGLGQCNGTGTVTKVLTFDGDSAWYYNTTTTNCGNANRTGCWQPLITPGTMPPGAAVGFGNNISAYEIVIAPSDTTKLYMIWGGDGCFYSGARTGSNISWTKGGSLLNNGNCSASDPNQPTKFLHPFIAVDPHTPSRVLASTPNSGASYTTNAGASWNTISTLGAAVAGNCCGYIGSAAQGGGTIFAFDESSWTSGATPRAYACTYGKGVYETTTGLAGVWTTITGSSGITACGNMVVDPTGVLWVIYVPASGSTLMNLYSYTPTTAAWTTETAGGTNSGLHTVAVDNNSCVRGGNPATCHLVTFDDGGRYFYTLTGSLGWVPNAGLTNVIPDTQDAPPNGLVATDQPWLAGTSGPNQSIADAKFDPSQFNALDYASGIGYFSVASVTTPTICAALSHQACFIGTSVNAAIEAGNVNWIINPPGGYPTITEWDREGFTITNGSIYPSTTICVYGAGVVAGWAQDWSHANPNFLVAMCNFGGPQDSSYSTDGKTWTAFSSQPPTSSLAGCIAASGTSNVLFQPGTTGGGNGFYITTNTGATWSSIIQPGGLTSGWGGSDVADIINCASDHGGNDYFYVYNNQGSSDSFWACNEVIKDCTVAGNWTEQCGSCKTGGGALYGTQASIRAINTQSGTLAMFQNTGCCATAYITTNAGVSWSAMTPAMGAIGDGKGCGTDAYELYTISNTPGIGQVVLNSPDGGTTWTSYGAASGAFPNNNFLGTGLDYIKTVSGDHDICGTIYAGSANVGTVYRTLH